MRPMCSRAIGLYTCAWMACIGISGVSVFAHAEEKEPEPIAGDVIDAEAMAETLGFLSKQVAANYQRLKTWSGEYAMERTFMHWLPPDPNDKDANAFTMAEVQVTPAVVSVFLDIEHDRLRSDWKQSGPTERYDVDPQAGTRVRKGEYVNLYEYRHIVTPEHWLSFSPTERLGQLKGWPNVDGVGQRGGRIANRKTSDAVDNEREFGNFIDPRDLFGARKTLFFDFCELYRSALDGERTPEDQLKVQKMFRIRRIGDGASTQYVCTVDYRNSTGGIDFSTETVFAAAVGFNVTSWREIAADGKNKYIRKFEYTTIDDIIVPSRMTYERFGNIAELAGMAVMALDVKLKSAVLNKELDDERFDMADLHIEYGDRLLDELAGQLFVADKSGFVEAADFVFDDPKSRALSEPEGGQSSPYRMNLLIANALIIFIVICVVIYRRRRTAAASR